MERRQEYNNIKLTHFDSAFYQEGSAARRISEITKYAAEAIPEKKRNATKTATSGRKAAVEKVAEPERKRKVYIEDDFEEKKSNKEYRKTYRKNENAFTMSVPYVIFLSVAVVVIVLMCINYLNINSEINETKNRITNLESQIDTLSAQNDAMDYEINGFVDVEYVLKVATEELGMINAKENQIKFYDSSDTEYMKQIYDIPN